MYAINFYSQIYVDMLRKGRKTATIRLGDKSAVGAAAEMRGKRPKLILGEDAFQAGEEFPLLEPDVALQEFAHRARRGGEVRFACPGLARLAQRADERVERFVLRKQSNSLRIVRTALFRQEWPEGLLLFAEMAQQVARVERHEIVHDRTGRPLAVGYLVEAQGVDEPVVVVVRERL